VERAYHGSRALQARRDRCVRHHHGASVGRPVVL